MGLQYELRLQKELTAPPIVFCQAGGSGSGNGVLNERMERIYNKLTLPNNEVVSSSNNKKKKKKEGIFSRTVKPSLFIGTRGVVASTAAYALGSKQHQDENKVQRVREVMKMGADGALIVLDWEIPLDDDVVDNVGNSKNNNSSTTRNSTSNSSSNKNNKIDITKPNSITKPIILLLHGMNNDSTFGYIRSMMHTATSRGWIAVCMNLRGQDGLHQVKNVTPRGYNAGYTGDLRGVVEQLEYRLMKRSSRRSGSGGSRIVGGNKDDDEDDYIGGPIYLLGYSLGANIVTKYLGEESLHGTLPKCIGGGAAMGNPLHIHSGTIAFPWNMLLGAGVKRSILQNASTYMKHNEPGFQHAMKKALLAPTIGTLDDAAAPYLIRNNAYPPYSLRIGFKDGEEYWWESSSHRYVGHVSVPLLKISAQDDFLVFGQFQKKLNHCLENPNVVVVKTRCGGHLGWQESPPPSSTGKGGGLLGGSGSWSDVAVADFIEALLQIRQEDREKRMKERRMRGVQEVQEEELVDTFTPPKIMSRL
jgi:predicted alpha/beta-fold hydrolase